MLNELIDKIINIEETALQKAKAIHLSIDEEKIILSKKVEKEQKERLDSRIKKAEKEADDLYKSTIDNAKNDAKKMIENAEKRMSKASDLIFNYLVKER